MIRRGCFIGSSTERSRECAFGQPLDAYCGSGRKIHIACRPANRGRTRKRDSVRGRALKAVVPATLSDDVIKDTTTMSTSLPTSADETRHCSLTPGPNCR